MDPEQNGDNWSDTPTVGSSDSTDTADTELLEQTPPEQLSPNESSSNSPARHEAHAEMPGPTEPAAEPQIPLQRSGPAFTLDSRIWSPVAVRQWWEVQRENPLPGCSHWDAEPDINPVSTDSPTPVVTEGLLTCTEEELFSSDTSEESPEPQKQILEPAFTLPPQPQRQLRMTQDDPDGAQQAAALLEQILAEWPELPVQTPAVENIVPVPADNLVDLPPVKKFPCKMCFKQYTRKYTLNRHLSSAHWGVRYQCFICGRIWIRLTSLQRHQRVTGHCAGGKIYLYGRIPEEAEPQEEDQPE